VAVENLNACPIGPHLENPGQEQCPYCGQPITHEKLEEILARVEAEGRQRLAQAEHDLKKQYAHEMAKAEARITKARKEAAKKVERQIAALKADHEAVLKQRLQRQHEDGEKAKAEAVNAERAKSFKERQHLDEKLAELQRQLQQKTANELGEGAEINLVEELKREFPDDQITRVARGVAGADIIHKVIENARICGSIIYDSKNRGQWRKDYAAKLRRDQLAAKADHAILSTASFPPGKRQVHLQDNVIIANPARVVVLAHLLRRQIVQAHVLRLSNEARIEKTAELYEFITSEQCAQQLDRIGALTDEMVDLDAKETKAHQTTWGRRNALIRAIQKALGDFTAEIDRIIGTALTS
jgi:hypothetical protein